MTKPLTDTRRFGFRCSRDAVGSECPALCEIPDALDGGVRRNFNEGVPVPKHLEQCNFGGAKPLVSALDARDSADEPNGSGIPWSPTAHRDRFASWHLRRESERERCAPAGGTGAWRIDHLTDEAVE
jgi:hypothetical protein